MNDKKMGQAERIQLGYARLIEKQTGKAVRPYRADGYMNLMNRYGTQKDSHEHYQFAPEPVIPDDTLTSIYEGNGLFAKIIDAPAEEALKHGFKLDDVSDEAVESFYQEALDELDWAETAMTALKWARLFGGSIAVMLINDGGGLEEPLNWKRIRSIDDIRVYDRSVIQPDYSTMFSYDPRTPFSTRGSRLGMPEFYHVNSRFGTFTVHESRCLVFQNGVLPENSTNSVYQLWGMPEYIRLKRALRDAEIAHSSAPRMLDRSVQPVYKMKDLASLLATEEGESQVLKRLQVIDLARGLLNSLVIDNEGEDYDFKSFQFSGVSDVVDTACNFLSALTNIPQTILFGRSPAGMNSTGESDFENWYSYVGRIQQRMVKGNLRYLLSVIFQAGLATGEVDEVPKIKVSFNPLWTLSDLEKADLDLKRAQTAQAKAQTVQTYVSMEAIDPTEVRRKLADSGEFDIDTILDEYEDEEELMAAYMGEEVAPGVNGHIAEEGDFDQYAAGVNIAEHDTNPGTTGSAPATAPTASKLPQDMTVAEQAEVAENLEPQKQDEAPFGVGVLVIRDGKILTGSRHNDTGYGLICGPGGHGEKGETPAQAAFRETEEEFGISPKELIPIGIGPFEPESGLRSHIFLCTEFEGEPDCVDLEMTNPRFRTLEELNKLAPSLFPPFADSLDILSSCLMHMDSRMSSGGGRLDEDWITVNGTHIPLDDDGNAMGGGKLKGKNFSRAKSQKKSSKKTGGPTKSIDTIKTNHYSPIEREALKNPAIAMGYLMSTGEITAQEYVEMAQNGTGTERARKYIERKYADMETRYANAPDGQKRIMEMTTEELNKYVTECYETDIDSSLNTGSRLQHVVSVSGLDDKPEVVSREEFERIAEESPSGRIYRGVVDNPTAGCTAADIVDLTINGDATFVGNGMHSDGIYFSDVKATADSYAQNGGRTMEACISPNARVISYNDLMRMKGDRAGDLNLTSMDTGVFALYMGYNAISLNPVPNDNYYIALDRSALVFADTRTDAASSAKNINGELLAQSFNAFVPTEVMMETEGKKKNENQNGGGTNEL